MRFTVTVEGDEQVRRTFEVGDTDDDLDAVLEDVRDFLLACESDPQAALDDAPEED